MNHPIMFLDRDNKTKVVRASFPKTKFSVIDKNNRFNLSIIMKLIKLFYLHCSCKKVVESDQKNFTK